MTQIIETDMDGTTYHYKITNKTKLLHNPDGPAIVITTPNTFGRNIWYIDGKRHRTDGPAVEWQDGDCDYYVNGKRHRLDGPAIIRFVRNRTRDISLMNTRSNDILTWYVNGKYCETIGEYETAVARWTSYREVTREDIISVIGNFRIVEW